MSTKTSKKTPVRKEAEHRPTERELINMLRSHGKIPTTVSDEMLKVEVSLPLGSDEPCIVRAKWEEHSNTD